MKNVVQVFEQYLDYDKRRMAELQTLLEEEIKSLIADAIKGLGVSGPDGGVAERLDAIEKRLGELSGKFDENQTASLSVDDRVAKIEQALSGLDAFDPDAAKAEPAKTGASPAA